jgi:hypothetical protein
MKNKPLGLTFILFIVLILVSCNLVSVLSPAAAVAANPTVTSTVQTTLTQPAQPALQATNPPIRPPVVSTLLPTLALSAPTIAVTSVPCDRAALVADVTVPDGTVVTQGDAVVKTWRLMNIGSCTWTTAYKLIFDHGYNFLGVKSIYLAKPVAPGETADISLNFTAPDPLGAYQSFWNLQGPAGTGPNGGVPLEIRIVIQAKPKPTATAKK